MMLFCTPLCLPLPKPRLRPQTPGPRRPGLPQVTDPRVTLSRALDAAGAHVSAPAARQAVYDEMASAMQKVGLLMTALAHKN